MNTHTHMLLRNTGQRFVPTLPEMQQGRTSPPNLLSELISLMDANGIRKRTRGFPQTHTRPPTDASTPAHI